MERWQSSVGGYDLHLAHADQPSDQAMTNAIVAIAGLVFIELAACMVLGFGGYLAVRLASAPPVRDEPGGRATR